MGFSSKKSNSRCCLHQRRLVFCLAKKLGGNMLFYDAKQPLFTKISPSHVVM
jgi:hypothetical protein